MLDCPLKDSHSTDCESSIIKLNQMIEDGNIEGVLELLEAGVDPNGIGSDQFSPLFLATTMNNLPIVRALLAKGAIPSRVANGHQVQDCHALTTPFIEAEKRGLNDILAEFELAMKAFWKQIDKTSHILEKVLSALNDEGLLVDVSTVRTAFSTSESNVLEVNNNRKYPVIKTIEGDIYALFTDEILGEGSSAKVYIAQNLNTKELCAVKESALFPIDMEERALTLLNRHKGHQTIVRKWGTNEGYERSIYYIFMTLHQGINGFSVLNAIKKHNILLTPIEQLKMIQGILKCIQAFRQIELWHADLRNYNFLIEPVTWESVIIDFEKCAIVSDSKDQFAGFKQAELAFQQCCLVMLDSREKHEEEFVKLYPEIKTLIRELHSIVVFRKSDVGNFSEYLDAKLAFINQLINTMQFRSEGDSNLACSSDSHARVDIIPVPSFTLHKKRTESLNGRIVAPEDRGTKLARLE